MLRIDEPGWMRIGIYDDAQRRSLWLRMSDEAIELCSGREGDDKYVRIARDNPSFDDLHDVMCGIRFARERLIDKLACDDLSSRKPLADQRDVPQDLRRVVEDEIACRKLSLHFHESSTFAYRSTLDPVCQFKGKTEVTHELLLTRRDGDAVFTGCRCFCGYVPEPEEDAEAAMSLHIAVMRVTK
jgi:hypothetical protein